jgi:hypothetical protein
MLPGRVDLWYDSEVTHFQAWRLFAPTAGESYTQSEDPADRAPTAQPEWSQGAIGDSPRPGTNLPIATMISANSLIRLQTPLSWAFDTPFKYGMGLTISHCNEQKRCFIPTSARVSWWVQPGG